jgi:tRNA(fMet)-specific endonuclease VapC
MYFLDTNVISEMARNPHGKIASRLVEAGDEEIATSSIVLGEILFGLANRPESSTARRAERFISSLVVCPFDNNAAREYAGVRAWLKKNGSLIGSNDMLIAAHALALEATLVTDNEKEFSRVPGLKIENWLRQ